MHKFVILLSDMLVRYYMEIIAGIWAVIIMMPLDSWLYKRVTGDVTYLIDRNFIILFVVYTIFYIGLGHIIPKLRRIKATDKIKNFIEKGYITQAQGKIILKTIDNSLSRQKLNSKYGLSQWVMKNLFSIGITFSYFAAEGFIVNTMFPKPFTVPIVFTILFISLLLIEHFMDGRMANKMIEERRKREGTNKINIDKEFGVNKAFMLFLFDSIRGSNLSDKVSDAVYEDIITDIISVIKLSDNKLEAKKIKKTSKKIKIPKGKLEKEKQGKVYTKKSKIKSVKREAKRNIKKKKK